VRKCAELCRRPAFDPDLVLLCLCLILHKYNFT